MSFPGPKKDDSPLKAGDVVRLKSDREGRMPMTISEINPAFAPGKVHVQWFAGDKLCETWTAPESLVRA